MKKNGFTLIELLAVIVILAIIALIATPIILGIINDAREKANERSVELYASAVRNGIATYQLTSPKAPTSFSELNIQYDGDVKCTVQELYEDGSFYLEGCKVNNGEKEYNYGTKQGATFEVGKMSICNPLNVQKKGSYTPGDKYECDVDPSNPGYDQMFYILNSDGTSVNLIMDSNIRTGGEAVKEENPTYEQRGLVSWVSKEDYTREDIGGIEEDWYDAFYAVSGNNDKGPITAIEYLQEATLGWTNVNPQTVSMVESYDNAGNYSGTYNMPKTYTVNARMPYQSEVGATGCDITQDEELSGSCPLWMVDYLSNDYYQYENRTGVSNVNSYWLLSSSYDFDSDAWYVGANGDAGTNVSVIDATSVRPVINLLI